MSIVLTLHDMDGDTLEVEETSGCRVRHCAVLCCSRKRGFIASIDDAKAIIKVLQGLIAEKTGAAPGKAPLGPASPDFTILPWDALSDVATVFAIGAAKYAPDDWALPNNGGGCHLKAALRHLARHCLGEVMDESGSSHVAHAAARLLMYIGKAKRAS